MDESNMFKENIINWNKTHTHQRNVLRVFMIERGLVGSPESSLVHRRSPKFINQSPKSKFLGLSLSTPVCLTIIILFLLLNDNEHVVHLIV